MVVRRRALVMGAVTCTALVASALYFWRFGDDHGLVPFLLGSGLLVVALVHGMAWHESRVPLLTVDMTGLMVRLGGRWVALPWNEIELVEITGRGRIGDGRVTVQPRDERRALSASGVRSRFAALLNRWLYDASLVVPFGLTARASVRDIAGTVTRLADGRVPVQVSEDEVPEPTPTVEVAGAGAEPVAEREPEPVPEREPERVLGPELEPVAAPVSARDSTARDSAPRRLAAVVSALRFQGGRRTTASAPVRPEPATVGTHALSDPLGEETEPLPELRELRRHAPEDRELEVDLDAIPSRSANVELVIDATADLSAGAMRGIRQRSSPALLRRPEEETKAVGPAAALIREPAAPERAPAAVAIGDRLRQARERLGVSVDDLAERTRIRPYVIESIELGDFSPCGADFYARGHLRMLTGVLGVDPAPLLASYDEHLASAPVSPRAVFDAELSRGVVRPTGRGSRWGALVAAVLVLLLVWGAARFFLTDKHETANSLGPPAAAGAAAHPGSQDIRDVQAALPEPTRLTLLASGGSSRVVVWDGAMRVVYQGVLEDGHTKAVSGPGSLRVMAVDGGVVRLAAPGHPRTVMGQPGQRVFVHVK